MTDPAFDCNVNRTKGDSATQLYLINHFLDKLYLGSTPVPDKDALNTTNAADGAGSLGAQVDTCAGQHAKNPTFMLVDFYEFGGGSVFSVAAEANGVTYAPTSPIATPLPDTTASGTSSSGSSGALPALRLSGAQLMAMAAVAGGIIFGTLSV